jgi:hypothetical protein
MGDKVERLRKANLVTGSLPDFYERVVEDMDDEHIEVIIAFKAKLDRAREQDGEADGGERLRITLDFVRGGAALPGRLVLEHPDAGAVFPRCLAIGYHVAHGTVHLLQAALERARELAPSDPVAARLTPYLERHLVEEAHGEEPGGGVLEDLEALGVDALALVSETRSPKIACLVGAQYYWIFHHHPVTVLGFLQLEALQPRASIVECLIDKTGLPRAGFRQLLLHAEVDVGHAEELYRVIDSLPLELEHERLVGLSALHTITLVTEALLDVILAYAPEAAQRA